MKIAVLIALFVFVPLFCVTMAQTLSDYVLNCIPRHYTDAVNVLLSAYREPFHDGESQHFKCELQA